MTRPAPVADREHHPAAEIVVGLPPSSGTRSSPASRSSSSGNSPASERGLQRLPVIRRPAEPEAAIVVFVEAAPRQIVAAARPGRSPTAAPRRTSARPPRRFEQRLLTLRPLALGCGVCCGTASPASPASRSTASMKSRLSARMTKPMRRHARRSRSNGRTPCPRRRRRTASSRYGTGTARNARGPARTSRTRRPTRSASETRLRNSSRKPGGKAMSTPSVPPKGPATAASIGLDPRLRNDSIKPADSWGKGETRGQLRRYPAAASRPAPAGPCR